jgi:dihydroxyacetone kinase
MGAHGEPGLRQLNPVPSPEALTSQMLDLLLDTSDTDRSFIPFSASSFSDNASSVASTSKDNEVVILLNSLGSTSDEVLARFAEIAIADLKQRGFEVKRLTLGPLVTSLKMSGFGITVWRLPPVSGEMMTRDEALKLWDTKVDVAAWRQ